MTPEASGLRVHPVERIGASLVWFESQLASRQLTLHPGCALARGIGRLRDLRARELAGESTFFRSTDDAFDRAADAIGADFLTKALHWGVSRGLLIPDDRWKDLGGGEPVIIRQADSSRERNYTWETVIAAIAATHATSVVFAEPDVLCTFEGKRYAVAAKVAYSSNKVTDNVLKGFQQADGRADASLVFVNVANLYPQVDTLRWSRSRDFKTNDEAVEAMTASVTRWCANFPLESWAGRMRRSATRPIGVAFFVPMMLHMLGAPRPFFYSHMPLRWAAEGPDYRFVTAFLRACNDVLGFIA
jgi:hypothetical protein